MALRSALDRANAFCQRYGLRVPILLGPMAGSCPPSLSIAVANAGGLGACGALPFSPMEILDWAAAFRAGSSGPFQMNLWIPDPPPLRDPAHEARLRAFLAQWGPPLPEDAGTPALQDFDRQCDAVLAAKPTMVSSVMGLYPPPMIERLKQAQIPWIATVSTVAEARAAAAAGADIIAAQGAEAGGHRGCFEQSKAERELVGLFSLLPAVVDAVSLPVIAAGGIADPRGVSAALLLGADAVQIGTAFLRAPEAQIPPAWADALATTPPEGTTLTRAFSGRAGRGIATAYVEAALAPTAPPVAPYPVQRALTQRMRTEAVRMGDVSRMQAWAGQSAMMARAIPAAQIVEDLWAGARSVLA